MAIRTGTLKVTISYPDTDEEIGDLTPKAAVESALDLAFEGTDAKWEVEEIE